MGKVTEVGRLQRDSRQKIAAPDATVVCDCCTPVNSFAIKKPKEELVEPKQQHKEEDYEQKDLVIIGAGPHALALVLRLLEPEADLSSDKERHIKADFLNRMRPFSQVRKHIQNLAQGPSAVYKQSKKAPKKSKDSSIPPPLSLKYLKEKVMVVDGSLAETPEEGQINTTSSLYGWMSGWKKNFETLNIGQLRSPISAHADPFDHRSLDFFGSHTGRDGELVPLEHLSRKTNRKDFHGPYNAPSTQIFHDFHRQLITGYGVQGIVQPGKVENIHCDASSGGQFELSIMDPTSGQTKIVRTPRVVCAVGPAYREVDPLMSRMALEPWQLPHRVLRGNQIIDFLADHATDSNNTSADDPPLSNQSILVIGGGVTSAHLALTAANRCKCPWCESVVFIQRSQMKERQFDLDTAWMGPGRGNRLDKFWSLSSRDRATHLKEERGGGSIHPEVIRLLKEKSASGAGTKLSVQEETEFMDVQYDYKEDKLLVSMDDGLPPKAFDMIWLATGFDNHVDNYPLLDAIRKQLPVDLVEGMPVLNQDLTWKSCANATEEPNWKTIARNRFWMMGPLAGLELGPDAVNLMGARHGAVRVATALRADICGASAAQRSDTDAKARTAEKV